MKVLNSQGMEGQETIHNESTKDRIPIGPFQEYGKGFTKEILSFQHLEFSRGR